MAGLLKLRNKKTGFIFEMTQDAIDNIISTDREGIFEVLEKDYVDDRNKDTEGEVPPKSLKELMALSEEELDKMKFNELKDVCIANELTVDGVKSKKELIKRIKGE